MRLAGLRRPRRAVRVAVVLLLCLLFQQVAVAAYACTMDMWADAPVATMEDCPSMAVPEPPALCQKHCNPDDSTTAEHRVAQVPPMPLPPPRFDLFGVPSGVAMTRHSASVPLSRSDPPPTLRFCSLLI